MLRICMLILCCLLTSPLVAEDIRVLCWNVESDGSNKDTIAAGLSALLSERGPIDLIGLTEVKSSHVPTLESAVDASGIDYRPFVSSTGGSDRLLIFMRKDRFELVSSQELRSHENTTFPGGAQRRPLTIQVRDQSNEDLPLIFMVNHLARGNDQIRRSQARGLREWARDQDVGIIAVGDMNFDFDFTALTGNRSMATFMRRDAEDKGEIIWKWIIPNATMQSRQTPTGQVTDFVAAFVDTNWADENGDGKDDFPNSILDFIFAAGAAKDWKAASSVIVRAGDFPDDEDTSDHRPIEAVFSP